jgi:hypothetical protein
MKKWSASIITIVLLLTCIIIAFPSHQAETKDNIINFVVIFPGGPDSKVESDNIINQFTTNLSKITGIKSSQLKGAYFNNLAPAISFIKTSPDSFIMGSLGFFLANKKSAKLVPLATIKLSNKSPEKFFLMAKKGRFENFKQMKDKKISGNVLYEDEKFLNKIIFDNKVKDGTFFTLMPSQRPLSALRQLGKGTVDGVLLNKMQYDSLKTLPIFNDVEAVFTSEGVPPLGMMMVDTPLTNSVKDKVVNALTKMCDLTDGKEVCKNFGLSGFEAVQTGELDEVIKKFDSDK